MKTRQALILGVAAMLMLPAGAVIAADQDQQRDQTREQLQTKDQDKMIYGWELMTVQERKEHRAKMQAMKTEEERMAYREEHHKLMQQRARERGMTLPDRPFQRGTGPGFGGGFGNAQGGGGKGR